jgi:hypothetical protein
MNVVADPEVEDVLRGVPDAAGCGLVDVVEEVGPFRLVRPRHGQLIDELVAFVGIARREERSQLIVLRQAARQIDVNAAKELFIGRQPGVRYAVLLHLPENEFVDEVLARHRPQCRRGAGRPQPFRQIRGRRSAVRGADLWMILRQLRLRSENRRHPHQQAANQELCPWFPNSALGRTHAVSFGG